MADQRDRSRSTTKQVHELQSQVKYLEEEVGLLRRRLTNAPRQVTLLEEKLVETREQLTRAVGQNEKLADALRAEREKIEALAEEVEKLSQPPASFGVYLAHQRRRLDRRVHGRSQDARDAGARHRPAVVPPRRAGRAERIAQRGRGARARSCRRGRQGQGSARRGPRHRDRPRRRGARRAPGRLAARRPAARRRQRAVRPAFGRGHRAAAQGRGRRARPRGDPRRQLRGHRRARGPDRFDPRRRGAAVPLRGAVRRTRAGGAQGRAALRPSRVRQDADRQGGREVPGREGRRARRARPTHAATS